MTDINVEDIVQNLDFDVVKKQKIFQKFLQEEFTKKNKSPPNRRYDGRSRSQDRHQYMRMNTIDEERSSLNNVTPQRLGSRMNLQDQQQKILPEESWKKRQNENRYQDQQYGHDNQYYDDRNYSNYPPYYRGGYNRFSPQYRQDIRGYNQQYNYSPNRPYSPPEQVGIGRSPPEKINPNRSNQYSSQDQNSYNEFQKSQDNPQGTSLKSQNNQSAEKNQPARVDNFNRRFPIKEQQQQGDQELMGHSQLVPGGDHHSNQKGNRQQSSYDNDGYQGNQRIKTSQSQQGGVDQGQGSAPFARDNRWYGGDQENQNDSRYARAAGRTSGSNKARNNEQQMTYGKGGNYQNHPAPQNSNIHPHQIEMREERIKILEQRCQDYENQISRINNNFEEFKQQAFRDNQASKAAMLNYEDTIQNLHDRLYELQTIEDDLRQENEKLRQKINHEQIIRTKLEEDLRELNHQLNETHDQLQQKEARRDNVRKEDEINHFKAQLETQKQKYNQTQVQQELAANQMRDEKDQLLRELQGNMQNSKTVVEIQDKQQTVILENKRLYIEIDDMKRQIQEMNNFIEQQKNEIYTTKYQLIEKAQKETQFHQSLEHSYSEIQQLKLLLQRAEMQIMDKQGDIKSPVVQPIPYGTNSGDFKQSQQFKTTNQQEQNKKNQYQSNPIQNNSQIFDQLAHTKRNSSFEKIYMPNSPQNPNFMVNEPRGRQVQNQMQSTINLGNDNMLDSPGGNRKRLFHRPQQPFADARQISAENKMISQQLKNKNTITPSNFLSWEVPDQHPQHRQIRGQQMSLNEQQLPSQQQMQQMHSPQKNFDPIDKMYSNAKQQLDNQQDYVSNQYKIQNNQQQNQQSQRKNERNINNERNAKNEYSQIYHDYMNDRNNNSPNQDVRRQNYVEEPTRGQVDPKQAIKNIDSNLMMLNIEKDKLKNELLRLEQAKLKSAQNIRRRNEITEELQLVEGNISSLKIKLREKNAQRQN